MGRGWYIKGRRRKEGEERKDKGSWEGPASYGSWRMNAPSPGAGVVYGTFSTKRRHTGQSLKVNIYVKNCPSVRPFVYLKFDGLRPKRTSDGKYINAPRKFNHSAGPTHRHSILIQGKKTTHITPRLVDMYRITTVFNREKFSSATPKKAEIL